MSDSQTTQPDVKEKARETFRDVKAKAADVTDNVTRAAKENAGELGDAAREFAESAKGKVNNAVRQQKSLGAEYLGSIAQATGRAADAFDDDLPAAAGYIRQAAERIQGAADTMRERDVREIVGDVQAFARTQPTLFFGGAVILGFAALRFLKSTAPASSDARGG
jgi:hypothetical protein